MPAELQQPFERSPYRRIVIDHVDGPLKGHGSLRPPLPPLV